MYYLPFWLSHTQKAWRTGACYCSTSFSLHIILTRKNVQHTKKNIQQDLLNLLSTSKTQLLWKFFLLFSQQNFGPKISFSFSFCCPILFKKGMCYRPLSDWRFLICTWIGQSLLSVALCDLIILSSLVQYNSVIVSLSVVNWVVNLFELLLSISIKFGESCLWLHASSSIFKQ